MFLKSMLTNTNWDQKEGRSSFIILFLPRSVIHKKKLLFHSQLSHVKTVVDFLIGESCQFTHCLRKTPHLSSESYVVFVWFFSPVKITRAFLNAMSHPYSSQREVA